MAELHAMTLTDLAAGLESGDFTSVEVTEALLGRIEANDAALNAFVTVTAEQALAAAQAADAARASGEGGVLNGLPLVSKNTTGEVPLYDKDSRIARIDTFPVSYPTVGRFKFFEDPNGRPIGRETVLVKITTESGAIGWGQCVPSNKWSYETRETVHTTITRYLTPVLIGKSAFDLQAINAAMNTIIASGFSTGQPICKAGS